MSVETVSTIFDLNQAFPGSSELRSEGDDHIRNIKKGLVQTFLKGLDASKPAAGTAMRFYYATDTTTLYIDTGSAWLSLTGQSDASTGDARWTLRATEASGWVWLNGRTMGHTGSGAALQGTDYQALFELVKTMAPNAGTETWGVDTVTQPNATKRILVMRDTTAGDTDYDALGETGGAKTITLAEANLPAHTHGPGTLTGTTNNTGNHQHDRVPQYNGAGNEDDGGQQNIFWNLDNAWNQTAAGNHTHTVTVDGGVTGSTGSGTAKDVKNPYMVFNLEVKL